MLDPTGEWTMTIDTPMGQQLALLRLNLDGDKLTGSVTNTSKGISTEIYDASIDGNLITWKSKMVRFHITMTFTVSIEENQLSGQVKIGMTGTFPVSGKRS